MSKVRSITKKIAPGSSPYNDWVEQHGYPSEKPGKVLPEHTDDRLASVLEALAGGIERTFSNQERRAFQLIVREGISEQDATDIISTELGRKVSRRTVRTHKDRAVEKIRKYVARKAALGG